MATGVRGVGEFCWFNILTSRPAEARAFFGEILGWTASEIPGMGHTVLAGGRPIGGLFDLDGPMTPKGSSAVVALMVKVKNADAACEQVTALGGRVLRPAFDIGNNLRMAVCADPDGSKFDLWESKSGEGTDVDSRTPGAPSWYELITTNTERATAFYSALLGWKPRIVPMPGGNYTTFLLGETMVAGMLQITANMVGIEPHWRPYFTVKDANETVRRATALGATVKMPMRSAEGVGAFGALTSPQGLTFHIVEYTAK